MFDSEQGWLEPALVRVLPPPPPQRITSPGGRRVGLTGQVGAERVTHGGVVLA